MLSLVPKPILSGLIKVRDGARLCMVPFLFLVGIGIVCYLLYLCAVSYPLLMANIGGFVMLVLILFLIGEAPGGGEGIVTLVGMVMFFLGSVGLFGIWTGLETVYTSAVAVAMNIWIAICGLVMFLGWLSLEHEEKPDQILRTQSGQRQPTETGGSSSWGN